MDKNPSDRFNEVTDKFSKEKQPKIEMTVFKWNVDWEYLPGKALRAIKNLFKKEK